MQKISLNSLRQSLKRYRYKSQLLDFIAELKKQFRPLAIVLFGSLARGDYMPESDADVLVLFSQPRVDFLGKISEIKELDNFGLVEVFPYGLTQFLNMLQDYNLIALDALNDGLIVHIGNSKQWNKVEQISQRVFSEVEPTELGWKVKRF